jgi:hypothetical protein
MWIHLEPRILELEIGRVLLIFVHVFMYSCTRFAMIRFLGWVMVRPVVLGRYLEKYVSVRIENLSNSQLKGKRLSDPLGCTRLGLMRRGKGHLFGELTTSGARAGVDEWMRLHR